MRRKIIKQAGQAFTITLPIDWVRDAKLKEGDEVEIISNGKELIIKTDNKQFGGKAKIDATNFNTRLLYYYLNATYSGGFDEIELIYPGKDPPDLNQMIGFAIVSQKMGTYLIKDISGAAFENLDDIFKQVFHIIIGFYESAIEDITNERKANFSFIRKKDDEINKYTFFLERSIMKKGHTDSIMRKIIFTYSFELEKIGDNIQRVWVSELSEKTKPDKNTEELIKLSKECLEKAFSVFYQENVDKIKELVIIRDKMREKADQTIKKNKVNRKSILYALNIAEDCVDLTHLAIMYKQRISKNNEQINT